MEQSHRDEYDTDMSLEYDEGDAYLRFLEFYEDVLPEFKEIGSLVQFKVIRRLSRVQGDWYISTV